MLEVDIEVPNEWPTNGFRRQDCTPLEYFSEFSPLFVTYDVSYKQFDAHMQQHVRDNNLSEHPRKLLVGGMKAE
jgi:hypothetical protein